MLREYQASVASRNRETGELRRAWRHKGFRLLALIPLILLALEAVEELRQGHFIFASLQRLVMR